jgi:hypothetical protein
MLLLCGHLWCNIVYDVAAGHQVHSLTPPVTDRNSTYSYNKKRSRPAATVHGMLDDAGSEDEGTTSRLRQTSPDIDVSLTDDVPPMHHQDADADDDDGWIGSSQEIQNAGEEYRSVMIMLRKKEQAKKVPPSYYAWLAILVL